MRKLNLENVEEFKPFEKVEAGGYVCGIIAVEDVPDKEYLKISYDIVEGDKKGFYTKLKKEKGWELPIMFKSYKESALSFFKGMITSVEKSNKGFKWSDDETKLINKKIGLVLGEEEYINGKGDKKVRMSVAEIHSVDTIKKGDFEIPEKKEIAQSTTVKPSKSLGAYKEEVTEEVDFFGEDADEECPFGLDD